ncbi:MAG: hypothetical protein KatS3mg115_0643 [Candidatus Poribacteria bacterium]|nr:MAG: hypothetical protein KatS3mg115_0643 [Candidatus Poribacteria bacterium]
MNWTTRNRAFRRPRWLPPVVQYLLIANVAVFLLEWVLISIAPSAYFRLFDTRTGLFPLRTNFQPEYAGYFGMFRPWQLVTYMFQHNGLFHLLLNMFLLWIFGAEVEERWGSRHFGIFYFLCGVGGGLLQILAPMLLRQAPQPVVGASGAVAGVLLAFGMMFPNRIVPLPLIIIVPVPARIMVILYAGVEIVRGVLGNSNIAHFAHLGGMLFGYFYIKYQMRRGAFYRE